MLEKGFEKELLKWCKTQGFLCLKMQNVSKGFPDRCVITKTEVVFPELKRPDGTGDTSPHQVNWISVLNQLGTRAGVFDNLTDAKLFILGVDFL